MVRFAEKIRDGNIIVDRFNPEKEKLREKLLIIYQ